MPTKIPSKPRENDLETKKALRGKRMPREERRRQLVNVACPVFAERGYDATSLEEIAERAGVSRPILYSHFGDKQGLFEAVVGMQIAMVTRAAVMRCCHRFKDQNQNSPSKPPPSCASIRT